MELKGSDQSELTEEEQRNAIITTITLDVSNKHLREVPKSIKNFTNIEFLYLSTNDIKCIPDYFFTSLPQLKWLDFRHNLLTSLPKSIGKHRQLRTLLLQGNNITHLPAQLGNVPTLTGLNIADNPIEYPPATVLQSGTQEILKFLRVQLQDDCQLIPELIDALSDVHVTENEGYLGSGEEDTNERVLAPVRKVSRRKNRNTEELNTSNMLSHRSATLLPRKREKKLWSTSDTIITTTKARIPRRRKKFKSANPVERIRHSDHYIQKVSQAIRDYEEKRMQAIRKEENSRTEMMVQRMRDRDALKMWRQQSLKQIETRKGQKEGDTTVLIQRNHTLDSIGPIKQRSVTMTNKEMALRNKIKEHANRLRAYHAQAEEQKKRSEASYNLQEAQSMHDEISKLTQEYRFKAFTGELMDY